MAPRPKPYVVKGWPAVTGFSGAREVVFEKDYESLSLARKRYDRLLEEGKAAGLFHRLPAPSGFGSKLTIITTSFPPVKESGFLTQPLGPIFRRLGY